MKRRPTLAAVLLLALATGPSMGAAHIVGGPGPTLPGDEDFWGAYLLEASDPTSRVLDRLEKGIQVQVDVSRSNDHYLFVTVSSSRMEPRAGYVWKDFVSVVGVVHGRHSRVESPAGGYATSRSLDGAEPEDRTAATPAPDPSAPGETTASDPLAAIADEATAPGCAADLADSGEDTPAEAEEPGAVEVLGDRMVRIEHAQGELGQVLGKISLTLDEHLKLVSKLETDVASGRVELVEQQSESQRQLEARIEARFETMGVRLTRMESQVHARKAPEGLSPERRQAFDRSQARRERLDRDEALIVAAATGPVQPGPAPAGAPARPAPSPRALDQVPGPAGIAPVAVPPATGNDLELVTHPDALPPAAYLQDAPAGVRTGRAGARHPGRIDPLIGSPGSRPVVRSPAVARGGAAAAPLSSTRERIWGLVQRLRRKVEQQRDLARTSASASEARIGTATGS